MGAEEEEQEEREEHRGWRTGMAHSDDGLGPWLHG